MWEEEYRKKDTERRKFKWAIGISLVVHFVFWIFLVLDLGVFKSGPQPQRFEVSLIDSKKISSRKTQIVQTAPGEKRAEPQEDAFWGEQNQHVDRQTVNQNRETKIGKERTKLSQLGVKVLPESQAFLKEQIDRSEKQEEGAQAEAAQDYVKGLKESESTALNTREFIYFGYFQRIRERLDLAWSRTLRARIEKLYRAGRVLASDAEHLTKLLVFLDGAGAVVRVQVLEASGVRDLDEAAIRAFNEAGPFPNPPRGLMQTGELIPIRWDFVLRS